MLWRRREGPFSPPKRLGGLFRVMVCCVDPNAARALAGRLTELRICEAAPLLIDVAREAIPICQQTKPDILVLEAMPDAMEKLDDPDKDISGRCELSARIKEVLPGCRVYLTCAETFRRLEPVMQKAVETRLIDGYHFGTLTARQMKAWLSEG